MIEFFKRLNRNKVFRLILSLAMVCVSAFLQVYIINVFISDYALVGMMNRIFG